MRPTITTQIPLTAALYTGLPFLRLWIELRQTKTLGWTLKPGLVKMILYQTIQPPAAIGAIMLRLYVLFLFAIFLSLTLTDSVLQAQGGRRRVNRQATQSTHGLSKPKTEIKVRMPDDATKPVLVLDMAGGFRMKDPAGFEPTPMLQIFSDGRVLTGRKSNLVKEVEGKIDLIDLQQLLVFASDDSRFFDLTSEMVKADIEANRSLKIMDAPTTDLEINLKGHSNKVSVYGLPFVPGKLADVPSVTAMLGIVSRCKRIVAQTRLGSDKDAEAAIAAVNKALTEKSADAPKFTLANLQSAEQFVDGRRRVSFVQKFEAKEKSMMAYATLQKSSNGKELVNLQVIEQKPKRGR